MKRSAVVVAVFGTAFAVSAAAATAAWQASGSNSASLTLSSAGTGATPVLDNVTGSTVNLKWAPSTVASGVEATSYVIAYYAAASGGSAQGTQSCPGPSSAGFVTCAITGVGSGHHFFGVKPVYNNWNGLEGSRLDVNVAGTDGTAPTTTATLSPAANGNGYNNANVVVNLSSTDNVGGSGVASITYSASGAQTIGSTTVSAASTSTPAITAEGTTTVSYSATDVAGNAETVKTITIKLDKTNPTNALSLANQSGGSFLTGNTIYYRGVAVGSFQISNAVADTGTGASGPASSTTNTLGGTATGWTHAPSTVSTPAGGPYVSSQFSWAAGTASSPTEAVTGKDAADNTATSNLTFTNDSTAPNGALTVNGVAASGAGSTSNNTSGTVTINTRTNFTDADSGIASSVLTYQTAALNADASCDTFGGSTTIVGTAGPSVTTGNCYRYTLTGTDNVGNTASISTTVKVDTVAPTVTVEQAAGQADPTNSSPINFTATFSEQVTGFTNADVTVGGTTGGTKTVTVTGGPSIFNVAISGMTDGTVTASIAANTVQDLVGNHNTASTSTDNAVSFDGTAPTVTINQASGQADPTNASPINFTATFSEQVTGFTNADVTVGGTAGGSKSVTVTGGPTVYNVAVSGMTDGTVTASIAADTVQDLVGNNSTASTSTDNTVTYDTAAPTGLDIQGVPSTADGKPTNGDKVVYSFSKLINPASIKSGWDGSATTVTAHFDAGSSAGSEGNAALTITGVALGSVDLGSTAFANNHGARFDVPASMAMTTVSGKSVVTVTLTLTVTKTAETNATLTWTPDGSATDLLGNAVSTAKVVESGSADLDF